MTVRFHIIALLGIAWTPAVASTPKAPHILVLPADATNLDAGMRETTIRLLVAHLRRQTRGTVQRLRKGQLSPDCPHRPACLRSLAHRLAAQTVIGLRVARLGGTAVLRLTASSGRDGSRLATWQETIHRLDKGTLDRALQRMIGNLFPARVADQREPPWYTNFWLWGGIGAAVVGTTAAVLAITLTRDPAADVVIRPP